MQDNSNKDNSLCKKRFCSKLKNSTEKRYELDGILYPPCYSSTFECLLKTSPVLLSDCDDARLVRDWFRSIESKCGLSFLRLMWVFISINFEDQEPPEFERINNNWKKIPTKQRSLRINKINGLINKLVIELELEENPYIPPAYEFMQSFDFFWRFDISKKMHTYSEKEGVKTIYKESMVDLLQSLSVYLECKKNVTRHDERPETGDFEKRVFARIICNNLLSGLTSHQIKPKQRPLAVIAALVRLRFGDEDGSPSVEDINNWLRKKAIKNK